MSGKQAPEYIRKIVKFGEKELELFSIDGLTWSSRPEELHLIQERRENSRVSFGDKRIAPRPGANRPMPKKGARSSVDDESSDDDSYLEEVEVEDVTKLIVSDQDDDALVPKLGGAGRSVSVKQSRFETDDVDEAEIIDSSMEEDDALSEKVAAGRGRLADKGRSPSKSVKESTKIKVDTKKSSSSSSASSLREKVTLLEKVKGATQSKARDKSSKELASKPAKNIKKTPEKPVQKTKSAGGARKVAAASGKKTITKKSNSVKSDNGKTSKKLSKQTKGKGPTLKKGIPAKESVATTKITEKKSKPTKKKQRSNRK